MTTLPPGDQNEFVSAVPLPDTVSKSIQAFVQELVFRLYLSVLGFALDRPSACEALLASFAAAQSFNLGWVQRMLDVSSVGGWRQMAKSKNGRQGLRGRPGQVVRSRFAEWPGLFCWLSVACWGSCSLKYVVES